MNYSTQDAHHALFTDLLETDFLHVRSAVPNSSYDIGWIPQNYETSPSETNGPFGMAKESSNVIANYIENQHRWNGSGIESGDPGLQLWVDSSPYIHSSFGSETGYAMIRSAELVSERDDILYGSFRIAMKTTSIDGTCAAFFCYRNNSQEIDTEILSAQQHGAVNFWPIHLVVQNTTPSTDRPVDYSGSVQEVYNLSSSLPGGTTGNYNEYRFDWLPDHISYYVNGQHAWTTTENVPSTAGRIHLSHWSNGNPLWSGGPPEHDAVLTVSYVKAYFNSTNSTRTQQYAHMCPAEHTGELNQTCEIPTQFDPPNPFGNNGNETGHTFFFTQQHNMTPGQTVYSTPLDSPAMRQIRGVAQWVVVALLTLWVAMFPVL
jgi:hypothetical protein